MGDGGDKILASFTSFYWLAGPETAPITWGRTILYEVHRGIYHFREPDSKDPLICAIPVAVHEKSTIAGAKGLLRSYHVPKAGIKRIAPEMGS